MWFSRVKIGVLGFLIGGALGTLVAQDVHFSQYVSLPVYVNPALTGFHSGKFRINAVYRDQWRAIPAPFMTAALTADAPIPIKALRNDRVGAGMFIYHDRAGAPGLGFVTTDIRLQGSFMKMLSYSQYLSAGISFSYASRKLEYDKATTDAQWTGWAFDPDRPIGENFDPMAGFVDLGVGVAWFGIPNDKLQFLVGGSAFHPLRPNISVTDIYKDRLNIRFGIHGQVQYNVNPKFAIIPGLWAWMQGPHIEGIGGLLFKINLSKRGGGYYGGGDVHAISFGGMFRVNDAVIPMVRYEYEGFTIMASYDLTISRLSQANNGFGGFEVGIGYIMLEKRGRSMFKTPRF